LTLSISSRTYFLQEVDIQDIPGFINHKTLSCVKYTILYITKRKKNTAKQSHAMDCEMPSKLTNVEMWTQLSFLPSSTHILQMFFICFPPLKMILKRGIIQKGTRFKRSAFTLPLQLYSDIIMALFKQIKQIIFNCSAWFWKNYSRGKTQNFLRQFC